MKRLRIFILHASDLPTDYMPHGDGLLAYRYITELAERGHELTVLTENSAIGNPIPANVTLIDVGAHTGTQRISYMRKARTIFQQEHARRPFDLVHQLNPVFCGLSLALIGLKIPLVLGPYVTSWPKSGKRKAAAFAIRALRFLEQSQARSLILAGAQANSNVVYPGVRTTVIPYGIDIAQFAPREPAANERPTITWLGPIAHRKGIIPFMHALNAVRTSIPNVLVKIAGTGEAYEEMAALIDVYELHDNVRIMGSIPRAEVPEYLASGDVLCQASFGEPYGMSIVEAMALGRPIVATAAGGFLDTVRPEGGILVPLNDPQALAAALIRVLTNPERARAMGEFNVQRAKTFDWAHVIDELETLYASIIP